MYSQQICHGTGWLVAAPDGLIEACRLHLMALDLPRRIDDDLDRIF